MADSKFALVRNFSATKYYQTSVLPAVGTLPMSFGALIVPHRLAVTNTQYICGNAPAADATGFSIRQLTTTGQLHTAQGTVDQNSGTTTADADPAGGTFDAADAALVNQGKSLLNASLPTTGGVYAYQTPRPNHACLVVVTVDGTNQNTYVNGGLVAVTARNTTTSAEVFRVGLEPDAANMFADEVSIGGIFYHSAALTEPEVVGLSQACMGAKDVVANYRGIGASNASILDYCWSVKQSLATAVASWASTGGQTSVPLLRNGTWTSADTYALDVPWL